MSGKAISIFLFEDEPGPTYIYKQALKDEGYEVHHEECVSNYDIKNAKGYSLFLLDIEGQRDCDEGLKFAEKLRKASVSAPIVISSATSFSTRPDIIQRIRLIDKCEVLERPHSLASLIRVISTSIGRESK